MSMKLFGVVAALSGVLSAVLATPSAASWWGDSTYEECMVSQMKGQAASMFSIADKLCKRKFKQEVYVPRDNVTYNFFRDGRAARIEISKSDEYDVTRMEVQFAGKKCSDSKPEDWGEIRNVIVSSNIGAVRLVDKEIPDGPDTCMSTKNIYGTYK